MTTPEAFADSNVPLPEGFDFVSAYEVRPEDIMTLRESVGWDPDTSENWQKALQTSPVFLGVHNKDNELIGMARVSASADLRHGVVCDMCVKPDFQGMGVGKAMAIHGLGLVEKAGIKYLYGDMSDKNPLGSIADDAGFHRAGSSIFRAAPNNLQ